MSEQVDGLENKHAILSPNCSYIDGEKATLFAFGRMVLCTMEKCPYGDNLGLRISYEAVDARICNSHGIINDGELEHSVTAA